MDLRDRDWRLPGELFGARALSERSLSSDRTNYRLFFHVCWRHLSLCPRAAARTNGRLVGRSEALATGTCAPGGRSSRHAFVAEPGYAGSRRGPDSARHGLHVSVRDSTTVASDCPQTTRPLHGHATDLWRRCSHRCPAILWLVF